MTIKSTRSMSAKGFLQKVTTAKSALGFLDQYREYMTTGELAPVLSPILAKVETGSLLPTPAVNEIANAVMNHIITSDMAKLEKSVEDNSKPITQKNYLGTILDENGNICTRINDKGEEEDLIKSFDLPQDCMRWLDRRLFDGAPSWHGIMEHTKSEYSEIVLRDDSIARILKKNRGPVVAQRSKSTKTLSFGVRAKQDRASFSRG